MAAEPAELLPERRRPVDVDESASNAEKGPEPAGRDPKLVQILRIVAAPRAGVVDEEGAVLRLEGDPQCLPGRSPLPAGAALDRVRQVERAVELRLQRPGRRRARPAQLLLDLAQGSLVAVEQFHLDLAETARYLLTFEDGDAVVDDLGAPGANPLPARAQARHGHEPGAAQVGGEQLHHLHRRPRRRARRLELQPGGVARQLELPQARSVLDAMPERHAMPREPEVGGVVVGGDEDAGSQALAAELGQDEPLSRSQLDLALERLLHLRSEYSGSAFTHLSDWLTCRPVKISLTPKTTEFFVLFAQAGENALEVARLVERRFHDHPNSNITQEQVKAAETAGDTITRDLITLLNTQYLTPFDREDIYQLTTRIDDVVDNLEEASDLLGLYGVEMPTRHAVEQCTIIVKAVELLALACANLKGMRGVHQALIDLKSLEDQGDRVLRDALASLFRDDRIDPLIVIRWKDIYESLERGLDACETAANVIGNILVKNA